MNTQDLDLEIKNSRKKLAQIRRFLRKNKPRPAPKIPKYVISLIKNAITTGAFRVANENSHLDFMDNEPAEWGRYEVDLHDVWCDTERAIGQEIEKALNIDLGFGGREAAQPTPEKEASE